MKFRVQATLSLPADVYFLERDSAAFRALLARSLRIGTLEIVDGWRVDSARDREEQEKESLELLAAATTGGGRSKRAERARAAAAAASAAAATTASTASVSASASASPSIEAYRFVTRPNVFDFVPEKARARLLPCWPGALSNTSTSSTTTRRS